jgi:redox-sensing transcriptional repressor
LAKTNEQRSHVSDLSRSSVERLYTYYLLAQRTLDEGQDYVSSRQLAEYLSIGDTQVRKDMAAISVVGLPKRGYEIQSTMAALRRAMGLDQVHRAVLCGVGKLGRALLEYSRFSEFGFRVVGAFDIRPDVVETDVASMRVLHIEHLANVVEIFSVEIGILTVNVWAAQELCDVMVANGIKAIWNFAPTHLTTPAHVLVRNEDFAGSLAVMSHYLRRSEERSRSLPSHTTHE